MGDARSSSGPLLRRFENFWPDLGSEEAQRRQLNELVEIICLAERIPARNRSARQLRRVVRIARSVVDAGYRKEGGS